MAEIKAQVYKDDRPAVYFDRFHARARDHRPGFTYTVVRCLVTVISLGLFRTRATGTENVPIEGPVLLAPNHFSQMDHFFAGVYLRRQIRIMAKSQLFGTGILSWIFYFGGIFPVRRGHRDEEAFATVRTLFEQGGAVMVYAEGGRSRTGDLGEPRHGIGRMALESGIPVVPVSINGSAAVRRWRRLFFPKVTVQYGTPLTFPVEREASRDRQQEVANEIFDQVRHLYYDLEERGRKAVLREGRERWRKTRRKLREAAGR